jgi:hypothetical protein
MSVVLIRHNLFIPSIRMGNTRAGTFRILARPGRMYSVHCRNAPKLPHQVWRKSDEIGMLNEITRPEAPE